MFTKARFHELITEESGQGLAEYALVVGVIALASILVLTNFSTSFRNMFYSMMVTAANAWP